MTAQFFLDTNVLIYAAAGRETAEVKRKRAREVVGSGNFGTSTQVLQEFYVNLKRLAGPSFSPKQAMLWIDRLGGLPIISTDLAIVKAGIVTSERYKISYWDGAILAAAEALGATTLYSEDLSHGQTYGSVKVVNPFM